MKKTKENGITLIALVITIVVLIILAAVAINLSLGNNGIFNRAKTGKEMYQNAEDYEQTQIGKTTNTIDSIVDGNRNSDVINQILARLDALEQNSSSGIKVYKESISDSGASASKTLKTINVDTGNYLVIAVIRADTITNRQFFSVTGANQNMPIQNSGDTGTCIGYAENVNLISCSYVRESGSYANLYGSLIAVKLD